MSIKKKLHYLISGQLPEFVKAEHPQFVTFLEHYYKFLETSNQVHDVFLNAQKWNDIDETLNAFIPYYRAQFSYDIPSDTITTNRRLIKYINQYYEGKGSENSTEMFFRFMFNDTASVAYPGDYILRASDGKWSRKKYIKVETTNFSSENIFNLNGAVVTLRYLEYVRGAGNFERTITTRCYDVFETRPDIYLLEVDINPDYVFPDFINPDVSLAPSLGLHDTHVYVQRNNVTYGTITKQLISIKDIDIPGSKFLRDDSYFLSETGVEGTYFASDYTEATTGPTAYVYETFQNNAVVRVTKIKSSPSEQYFLEDYVIFGDYAAAPTKGQLNKLSIIDTGERFSVLDEDGNPVHEFTAELSPYEVTGSPATITFNTGLIYHAPGEFKDNAGFLSDIIKLQDNDYYQPYSYVVRSTTPLNEWKDMYLDSTHPAGFKLFAELLLTDDLDVNATITDEVLQTTIYDLGYRELEETVTLTEEVAKSFTQGPVSDTLYLSDTLQSTLTFIRDFSETVNTNETITKQFSLDKTENVTVSENTFINVSKITPDLVAISDTSSISTNLSITDSLTVSDNLSYDFNQQNDLTSDLEENISSTETLALQVSKPISDSIGVDDTTLTLNVSKNVADAILTSEDVTFDISLVFSDVTTTSDTLINNFDQRNDATSDLQENVGVSDELITTLTFIRELSDTVTNTDVTVANLNKSITDSQGFVETLGINTDKSLIETQSTSETGTIWVDSYFVDGEYSPDAYVTGEYVGVEYSM